MGRGHCGPIDPSVLYDQKRHVSTDIWNNVDRDKLYIRQSTMMLYEWQLRPHMREILNDAGFGIFAHRSGAEYPDRLPRNDAGLISALVERWRSETTSFHMPFGEITITLEDVYMLMGLPVYGIPLCFPELPDARWYWLNEWEDPRLSQQQKFEGYDDGISLRWLRETYGGSRTHDAERQVIHTRAYLLFVIGTVLFPTKSNDVVHSRYLPLLQDVGNIRCYAWGAAVLGYLFAQLSEASRCETRQMSGCTTLLMLWAYERLLPGRPWIPPDRYFLWPRAHTWSYNSRRAKKEKIADKRRPNPHHQLRPYRGMFDNFDMDWLTWEPYLNFRESDPELYTFARSAGLGRVPLIHWDVVQFQMPDRVMRQFGFAQHISGPPLRPVLQQRANISERVDYSVVNAPYIVMWIDFCERGLGKIAELPVSCSIEEYMHWYRRITKLKISPEEHNKADIQHPRDYYDNTEAFDVIQGAVKAFHRISLKDNCGDGFYEEVPKWLIAYDSFIEKHYPWIERPEICRPSHGSVDIPDQTMSDDVYVPEQPTADEVFMHPTAPTFAHKSSSQFPEVLYEAVKNLKAKGAAVPRVNSVTLEPSVELAKPKDKSEQSLVEHKDKLEPSMMVQRTRQASGLPSDFFDNHEMKKQKNGTDNASSENQESNRKVTGPAQTQQAESLNSVNALDAPPSVGVKEMKSDHKQVKGALPEGFFDNKDADVRARGITPVKLDVTDEYKEFEKLIQEDLRQVDTRLEEEEYDAADMIEVAESVEQRTYRERVETLKRKKMELRAAMSSMRTTVSQLSSKDTSDQDSAH